MQVILFGQPNSGKSALLAKLTSARVIASNYPGTTCEISYGKMRSGPGGIKKGSRGDQITVIDTPGVYALPPLTWDEKIAYQMLNENPRVVINVVDGTNLKRHLVLTLALLQHLTGKMVQVVIALNHADSMRENGIAVDTQKLSSLLGVPVIPTSAVEGEGVEELSSYIKKAVHSARETNRGRSFQPPLIELWHSTQNLEKTKSLHGDLDQFRTLQMADHICNQVSRRAKGHKSITKTLFSMIDVLMTKPSWLVFSFILTMGFLLSALVFLFPITEMTFRAFLYPLRLFLQGLIESLIPKGILSDALKEAIPEGFILPLATVFPAMVFGYISLALLEDTGLLARYAVLGDIILSPLNLPGQASFALMLGVGCRVPGIIAARTLPTETSRKIVCLTIANLVPCAATLSLTLPCIAKFHVNPLFPFGAVFSSFALFALVERVILGIPREHLLLELPPLRLPTPKNVLVKTSMRLQGFFTHVLPLVVLVNIPLRVLLDGNHFWSFPGLSSWSKTLFGLKPEALLAVLLTSAQRYLAPLFLLGLNMTPKEATVAITMVLLGFPCIPSAVTLAREQGLPYAILSFLLGAGLLTLWGVFLNYGLPIFYP